MAPKPCRFSNARLVIPLILTLSFVIAGCGGSGEDEASGLPSLTVRIEAARSTASTHSACTAISPFYWEIGDQSAVLGSDSTGDGTVLSTTNFAIASATKWLFGAYVVEKAGGTPSATAIKQLTMSSGYTSLGIYSCSGAGITTVQDCFSSGSNSTYTSANDNKFFYNGGHYQKWAVDNGLGTMTRAQLASEFQSVLGTDVSLTFATTQLAGGVSTNATEYGEFLRKVLAGNLLIGNLLGSNSVCTQTSGIPGCLSSVSTPFSEAFHYSFGHWVEDDPVNGDGSFSSPGLFGFYPWIDAGKSHYGVISRYQVPSGGDEIGSGYASLLCGRQIRKAFQTGVAQ